MVFLWLRGQHSIDMGGVKILCALAEWILQVNMVGVSYKRFDFIVFICVLRPIRWHAYDRQSEYSSTIASHLKYTAAKNEATLCGNYQFIADTCEIHSPPHRPGLDAYNANQLGEELFCIRVNHVYVKFGGNREHYTTSTTLTPTGRCQTNVNTMDEKASRRQYPSCHNIIIIIIIIVVNNSLIAFASLFAPNYVIKFRINQFINVARASKWLIHIIGWWKCAIWDMLTHFWCQTLPTFEYRRENINELTKRIENFHDCRLCWGLSWCWTINN